MKKLITLVLILAMTLALFAACGEPADNSGDTAKQDGFKVASHNATIEDNAYRAVYEDQMKEQAAKFKEEGYIGEFNSFVANNDPAIESSNIETTINEGYDIIIVNPIAASGLDALIAQAVAADITYVNADCVYPTEDIVNVVVAQDQWAQIQADFVVDTLPAGSKIVQFNGIDGNSASEIRNEVWVKTLEGAGMDIVKTVAHNWSDVESKALMSEIISSGLEFDGIINQEAANGIMDAIEEAGIDYPGCITSSEEVNWIRRMADINKNELVCPFIVVENPPGIGATALAVAINLAQGNELAVDKNINYVPQWIMTYDNMDERVESVSSLPSSTSVSSYMSYEDAKAAYFK